MATFPFSAPVAVVIGRRATFGQFRIADGAFVLRSNHAVVIPLDGTEDFTSQGNVLNAASRRGAGLLTGGSISVSALELHGNRFYSPLSIIDDGAVFADMPEDQKADLKAKVISYYGFAE